MAKKLISFKTRGMNRDLSVSAFNPEFSFENVNLRLSTSESNTFMSWVNEKGTAAITLIGGQSVLWGEKNNENKKCITAISGTPIGTAIINEYLVLFTHESSGNNPDHIYLLKYVDKDAPSMKGIELFNGNLGFSVNHPLETLVSYESELIQKIYWVDGKHQTRFINIITDSDKYYEGDEPNRSPINTSFDFKKEINLTEEVHIVKTYDTSGSEFPPGVIQYAFTYYNKYGAETAVFRTTPLQYIALSDRGGSPEEKVNVAFKIYGSNFDEGFEYLRIYSIIRTTLNATPIVRRIQDLPIKDIINNPLLFIDTNTTGNVVDPTHLLYLGGSALVIPGTIEQKDNTLFLGNLETDNILSTVGSNIKQAILTANGVSANHPIVANNVVEVLCERPFQKETRDDVVWINTLRCPENIVGNQNTPAYYDGAVAFKAREYYRLGIQFQNKYGNWSEPCWVGDKQWSSYTNGGVTKYGPSSSIENLPFSGSTSIATLSLPEFRYTISATIQSSLYEAGYRRMRAVYAAPAASDRTILCQGVINSTMYRQKERDEGTAYAQSSWLFRAPFNPNKYHGYLDELGYGNAGAVTYIGALPSLYKWEYGAEDKTPDSNAGLNSGAEYPQDTFYIPEWDPWVGQWKNPNNTNRVWMPYYRSTEIMGLFDTANNYQIDDTFGTVHSPDIEFSDYFTSSDLSSAFLRSIGTAELTSTYGDISITTSTDSIKPQKGFKKSIVRTQGTSALISGNFYEDDIVTKYDNEYRGMFRDARRCFLWPVCLWQRDGALNNDVVRGGQSATLKTKVIGNYRYSKQSNYNLPVNVPNFGMGYYGFTEAAQLIKVNNNIYKGCIDVVLLPDHYCDYYPVGLITDNNGTSDELSGVNGDISDIAQWDPVFTDLPLIKIHQDDIRDADNDNRVWLIQYNTHNALDDWCTTKNMPDYDYMSANPAAYISPPKYRWNAIGGEGEDTYEDIGAEDSGLTYHKSIVPIKYKSTPHVAVQIDENETNINTLAGTEALAIVEIHRPYNQNSLYGGATDEALRANQWIPCGPIITINPNQNVVVPYKWGDTYFQRYECLKTYPYTFEDKNQVVEVGSFMLETRANIDGRYDRNRGYYNILNVSPQNFNLMNPVYSQQDNWFNYRILPEDYYNNDKFSNQITWTLTKENGAEVDAWTNITLASTLEMDGNLGEVSKIIRFNDQLIAFQEKGFAQILYNENTQISTTEGVPIEIANSGKVQGKRYFSNTIGCSNKWSIITTPMGIYFMDSYNKNIYLFNGELGDLSMKCGFNTWAKENIKPAKIKWDPIAFNNFIVHYDRLNQDVLFINKDTALAFSEIVGNFTSFYDYGSIPYFCNLEDTGLWVTGDGELWQHQTGEYGRFFDVPKPYSMTLVGNPEPQTDKIFTNLEFRACTEGEGDIVGGRYVPTIPFDSLETWNEYQHGIANLEVKSGSGAMQHHLEDTNKTASLNRKFRMWRCDIPRDNAELAADADLGISRVARHPLDRMRNPWIYLKLMKKASEDTWEEIGGGTWVQHPFSKTEIHDLVLTYYN